MVGSRDGIWFGEDGEVDRRVKGIEVGEYEIDDTSASICMSGFLRIPRFVEVEQRQLVEVRAE